MSRTGKMEENNKPTVPETISTGTGSGSQASTPSPLASVTTKNEPRIFYFEEIIVSPTANNCVKGKGTSPSNLTRLDSFSNVPTSDIGVVEIRQKMPVYATTANPLNAKQMGFHGAKIPLPFGPASGQE
jgi:hypothetical protein